MLAIQALQASYGHSQVLFDLTLTVGEGEVVSLMGRTFMRPVDCPFLAADRALRHLEGRAEVVIGIAGELVKGFTTSHSQERKRPDQPITEGELQKLMEGVQKEALYEAERAITWETGLPTVDVRLVHAAVTGAQSLRQRWQARPGA